MSHADEKGTATHRVFTWIGVVGFAVGVIVIPLVNSFLEQNIDATYAVVVVAASLLAVGSKQVIDGGAKLIRAWRDGGGR